MRMAYRPAVADIEHRDRRKLSHRKTFATVFFRNCVTYKCLIARSE
jgi:hypothetical protein